MAQGQGLQQDVYRNQFAGVQKPGWGGSSSGNKGMVQSLADQTPYAHIGLPGGPPQNNVSQQDAPAGAAPTNQDAGGWTPPTGAIPGQLGQLPPNGYGTTNGPNGEVFYVPNGATFPAQNTQPPASTTPSTPQGGMAPTSAQVASNPSAWAGTSFDPSIRVGNEPAPTHNLSFIGTVGADGVNSSTAPEILAARQASLDAARPSGPPPGSVAIPGQPGNFMTPWGGTWGSRPANVDYDTWLKNGQDALRAGIRQQTPEAAAYLGSTVAGGRPVFSGNPTTEAGYLRAFGLA